MSNADSDRDKASALLARFDALSLRERLLVAFTLLVVIGSVWYGALMLPLVQRAAAAGEAIDTLQKSSEAANRNLEDQVLQLAGGGSGQQARLALVRQRIDEIERLLGEHANQLVDPTAMARVLEGILRSQSGLELVRIRNLAPEPLATSDDEDAFTFFRHGLEIEVQGSYFACLEYLAQVETLPWRLYWQLLELDVIEYPRNRIRIELSTLSLDEEWIGA